MIANSFCFIDDFIRPIGPITMVTRFTDALSRLLCCLNELEIKSLKKTMIENNFCFLVDFIRPTSLHMWIKVRFYFEKDIFNDDL